MEQHELDFEGPAKALVDILDEVDGISAYLWERDGYDSLPAVSVGVPAFRQRPLGEAESQLHTDDYFIDYPISFYREVSHSFDDQQAIVDGLKDLVAAIAADPTLGDTVFDSAITEGVPFIETDRSIPLVGYQVTVATEKLVQPDQP